MNHSSFSIIRCHMLDEVLLLLFIPQEGNHFFRRMRSLCTQLHLMINGTGIFPCKKAAIVLQLSYNPCP